MKCTDVHFRQLCRIMSKHTWLWTEMVVDQTIIHTPNLDQYLHFPSGQKPIVLQLGGSNPEHLGQAAKLASKYNYDEINLNCGCPSDRVAGAGCFGASLMLDGDLVGLCMLAIQNNTQADVSVKCRLGVDQNDTYQDVCSFISKVIQKANIQHFIIHARKCHLKGLNPHQNRTVPALKYEWLWGLKRDFPQLKFTINGGITSLQQVKALIEAGKSNSDNDVIYGAMIGRGIQDHPWKVLGQADQYIFEDSESRLKSRRQVLQEYGQYGDSVIGSLYNKGVNNYSPNQRCILVPIQGIFHGERGNTAWKKKINDSLHTVDINTKVSDIINDALQEIPNEALDSLPIQIDSYDNYFKLQSDKIPGSYILQDNTLSCDKYIPFNSDNINHTSKPDQLQNNGSKNSKTKLSMSSEYFQQRRQSKIDIMNQKKKLKEQMKTRKSNFKDFLQSTSIQDNNFLNQVDDNQLDTETQNKIINIYSLQDSDIQQLQEVTLN